MKERYDVECTGGAYRVLDPSGTVVATVGIRPEAFALVRVGVAVYTPATGNDPLSGNRTLPRHFSASQAKTLDLWPSWRTGRTASSLRPDAHRAYLNAVEEAFG
jgi:hypothetical protein